MVLIICIILYRAASAYNLGYKDFFGNIATDLFRNDLISSYRQKRFYIIIPALDIIDFKTNRTLEVWL